MSDKPQYTREQLITLLSHPSPKVRKGALLMLIKEPGEDIIGPIEKLRDDRVPEIRQLAAKVAAYLRDKYEREEAIDEADIVRVRAMMVDAGGRITPAALERILKDNDTKNKLAALRIVEDIFEPEFVEVLTRCLSTETNRFVIAHILTALGKCGRLEAMPLLLKFLEKDDPVLKLGALSGLERVADKSVLRHVIPLLKDKDPRISNKVKKIVSLYDGDSIVEETGYLLNSPDPQLRATGFAILKGMCGPSIVNMLLDALRDPEEKLQIAAYKELSKIQFYRIVKEFKKFKDRFTEKLKKTSKSVEELEEKKEALFKSTTIEGLSDLLDASTRQNELLDEKEFQKLMGEEVKLADNLLKKKSEEEEFFELLDAESISLEGPGSEKGGQSEIPAYVRKYYAGGEPEKNDWILRTVIAILILLVIGSGFFAYRILKNTLDSLKGNVQLGAIDLSKELMQKEEERKAALEGELDFIQQLITDGNYELAKKKIRDSLKRFSGHLKFRDRLAFIYIKTGDFERAREELVKILEEDKSYTDAYYYLGTVYDRLGKKEESEKIFQRLSIIDDVSLAYMKAEEWLKSDRKEILDLYAEAKREMEELRSRLRGETGVKRRDRKTSGERTKPVTEEETAETSSPEDED